MFPYNPSLTAEEHIKQWQNHFDNGEILDWYPNNEPETYAPCTKDGIFRDEALRKLYVEDMPLVVIIDSEGNNLYEDGRKAYLATK